MLKRYNVVKSPHFKAFQIKKPIRCTIKKAPKSNGLIKTEYIYFDDYAQSLAFMETFTPLNNETLDSMYLQLVEKLTKSLIRSLSNTRFKWLVTSSEKLQELQSIGANLESDNFGNVYRIVIPSYANACLDIVNSNFTQEIYNDILQSIACELWSFYKEGHCKVIYNFTTQDSEPIFIFDTYVTKKGNIKSYKYKLFSIIENTLNDYSNHSQSSNGVLTNLDSFEKAISPFLQDDDNKLTSQNINAYMRAIRNYNKFEHYNVLTRSDIQEFFRLCANDYSDKHIQKMKYVLSKLVDGLTTNQIHAQAQKDDIVLSIASINKIRLEFRELWTKYNLKIDLLEYDSDNSIITTYTPSTSFGKSIKYKLNKHNSLSNGYNTNSSALSNFSGRANTKFKALKKALTRTTLVNQNSDYAKLVNDYENSLEYRSNHAIIDYCANIQDTIIEPCYYYSYYLNKLVKNRNYTPIVASNYSVKLVKSNDSVLTYYDNKLVRTTPIKK